MKSRASWERLEACDAKPKSLLGPLGIVLSPLTKKVCVSSAVGIDGPNCGVSTATPCLTIAQGIENCATTGYSVLVRHGLYPTKATIALRDGVDVYGSCRFDGEANRHYRPAINAAPAPGTPAVSAEGVNSPTIFYGIVVLGKNETAGAQASRWR